MWSSDDANNTNTKNIRGHSCHSMTPLNGIRQSGEMADTPDLKSGAGLDPREGSSPSSGTISKSYPSVFLVPPWGGSVDDLFKKYSFR